MTYFGFKTKDDATSAANQYHSELQTTRLILILFIAMWMFFMYNYYKEQDRCELINQNGNDMSGVIQNIEALKLLIGISGIICIISIILNPNNIIGDGFED